jgi:lipid-A-disaccharide synthase
MRPESVVDSRTQDAPLFIIAGETSGDQHGAAMVRILRQDFPGLSIFGVGGEHLRAAGVETLFDVEALNVVGLVEVLAKIPSALLMARRLLRAARERGVRVVVLIDSPGFNLPFARWAKQAGLRVVYYVSPQIWAWRQNRVRKVARRVDKMLTLFPFEVPFYTAAGVDAEYVGHPFLDCLPGLPERSQAAQTLGLDAQRPVVVLLPGSRRREVERLLEPMLAALSLIRNSLPEVQGILPAAPTVSDTVQQIVSGFSGALTVVHQQSLEALCAADFAFVASGTATLEAGLIGTPMVIVYQVNHLTAWLARRLVRVPRIGLINIVAGRQVVPELLQEAVSPCTMAAMALSVLQDPAEAQRIRGELTALRATMGEGGSSRRAATSVGAALRQARDSRTDVRVSG